MQPSDKYIHINLEGDTHPGWKTDGGAGTRRLKGVWLMLMALCLPALLKAQAPTDGGIYTVSNVRYGYYLHPKGEAAGSTLNLSTALADGCLWEVSTTTTGGTTYYRFRNVATGLYINHTNGQAGAGAETMATAGTTNNSLYRLVASGAGYAIIPYEYRNGNNTDNISFNPYGGAGGDIGLYQHSTDNGSRWTFQPATRTERMSLSASESTLVTETGQYTLLASASVGIYYNDNLHSEDKEGITYSWAGMAALPTGTTYSTDDDGTLRLTVGTMPAAATSVVLQVTATKGSHTQTRNCTITYARRVPISSLSELGADGYYELAADIDDASAHSSLATFRGVLDGAHHTIRGLRAPLFATLDGGTVKNLRLDDVAISLTGADADAGAICNTAQGTARIYNCGVLATTASRVQATRNVGSLVGTIAAGSSVRVVNCYSYATVAGGDYAGGIVGRNQGTVSGTTAVTAMGVRIAGCMMYGDIESGTNRSPVYGGNHTDNVQKLTEYNYYRSRANLIYTAYDDQLAIDKDEFLTRFPFYRHILNTHRELLAYLLFGLHTEANVAEMGHWALLPDVAPYPIVEPWPAGTRRTTEGIAAALPATAESYAGRLLTEMGDGGYLHVSYTVGTTTGTVDLPITDMDTLRFDHTWGKVVLPYANELWTQTDFSKVVTGWKITSATKDGTAFSSHAAAYYDFSDRNNPQKDIYDATNNPYIFAQGGNYIVPYGVTAISIEANLANAFYLSDAYVDFGYDATYGSQTNLGYATATTYHGRPVHHSIGDVMNALATTRNPHEQAVVLVGNYHYNQNVANSANSYFENNTGKALTIMSVDEDHNQVPDYGWYSYHTDDRTQTPPIRFDFVPNVGIGMAARVTGSTPYPTIGIWHARGWFELTETCVSLMSECEINSGAFLDNDNGHGNNRWIANSGYFIQIVRARTGNCNKLSYVQLGGNAYVKEFYPGNHTDNSYTVTLRPVVLTGGEVAECYMTGYRAGANATGSDIRFWCAGGKVGKWLGAYMENPSTAGVNVTAVADHAIFRRFFGGGTSASAPITGNIDITMNNSLVDFYCGGPEFGDMAPGKTVTTHATGTTFGEYYGAGFGGTSITYNREGNNTNVGFGNATVTYPLGFNSYTNNRLVYKDGYGIGSCHKFEFILYSGGKGTGVARFYTGYAAFSLAQTGDVTNVLKECTVTRDFFGGGCQGTVNGSITSTLTGCTVKGSAYGGGYRATSNEVQVYPTTQPTYSVYTKETGLFSDFGTVEPETYTWIQGAAPGSDATGKTLATTTDMSILGTVTGNISLTLDGNTTVFGDVFGGGRESPCNGSTSVLIK